MTLVNIGLLSKKGTGKMSIPGQNYHNQFGSNFLRKSHLPEENPQIRKINKFATYVLLYKSPKKLCRNTYVSVYTISLKLHSARKTTSNFLYGRFLKFFQFSKFAI